jgi:hypothetical protein
MSEAEARALFERMHSADTSGAVDVAEQPFTDAEIERLREQAQVDIKPEEGLCVDFWGPELQPAGHQPRPGSLSVRGHAVSFECFFMLADPQSISTKQGADAWKKWAAMVLKHKSQCLACRTGKAIM